MNRIKYLYIILSIVFWFNNITPMEQINCIESGYSQEGSLFLNLPIEAIMHIISQAIIQQVKEDLSKWNTIFEKPKINLESFKGFYATSQKSHNVFNDALSSTALNNHIEELKKEKFKELLISLEDIAKEEYKGLTIDELNRTLSNILKKYDLSKIDYEKICKLVLLGADINISANCMTPLICSLRQGDRDMVELLIKLGADVDATNEYGETALMLASKDGSNVNRSRS
ncbi:ankyrin repeat domain-containing protein [Candidatus Babela massiliensis]|uniref:Ankyrin repeats containing protein n=1 Tax=Candidatus Babela massiliensis TaxID=673862 RepID=V6DFV1_9BACT|nr:ankyrin repeat domain-containing protein [Candidatus Babela massiliensis]CDK30419.1 Ankyrin repeats containing protein [Candidatus Babela massiliensis]